MHPGSNTCMVIYVRHFSLLVKHTHIHKQLLQLQILRDRSVTKVIHTYIVISTVYLLQDGGWTGLAYWSTSAEVHLRKEEGEVASSQTD